MLIPEQFVDERLSVGGDRAGDWLAALPGAVESLAQRWRVELLDDTPRHGANALVVLGEREGEPCAMKVCAPEHDGTAEATALRAWTSRRAVQLLDFSEADNVLLLERLDPDRTLHDVDLLTAAEVVGELIRDLAVPAPTRARPSLTAATAVSFILDRHAQVGASVPAVWAELAVRLATSIAEADGTTLVHTDLHSGNVLAGGRAPWIAIDPRPSVGHPEQAAAEMLLWRLPDGGTPGVVDLVETITSAGRLEEDRVRAWTIIRSVEHWLWCLDADSALDPDDPSRCSVCAPRCHRILDALV